MSIHFPFISPVTGVTFYTEALGRVKEGMVAELYHDKGNSYDSNAVAVKILGNQVGFLPKELAKRVVLSGGEFWSGVVVNVLKSHNGIGLRLSVTHPSKVQDLTPTSISPSTNNDVKNAQVIIEDKILPTPKPLLNIVKAKSGRILGTLISQDKTYTTVLTDQGREVRYPNGLLIPNL